MDDNTEESEKDRERRLEQDFADQQNEVAGREVGRIARFLPESTGKRQAESRRRKREQERQTLWMLLASNPVYAEVYHRVEDKLQTAQIATAGALGDVDETLVRTAADLEELMKRAPRLPDGRAVFRDAAGNLLTEDGRLVTPEKRATLQWHEDMPDWESYQARKRAYEQAQVQRDALLRYQFEILDPAFDRLHDQDNPPSMDELHSIEDGIEAGMPTLVRERYNPRGRIEQAEAPDAGSSCSRSDTSDLTSAFSAASAAPYGKERVTDTSLDNALSIPKL